jgi:high-affinity nickel-transport protein
MTGGALAVFVLGLRHGADPDHLAAVDNITRNSVERSPRLARVVGTLFAGGHTIMVLALAALAGYLGTRLTSHSTLVESLGTWVSIGVLLLLASFNLVALLARRDASPRGVRSLLLPKVLREAQSPWVAVPVGLLFGIGFETSSQIAAYTVAFGADVAGALVVGGMFCLGMACTDTLDCLFVQRLIAHKTAAAAKLMRIWILSVSLFAIAVALYEFERAIGLRPIVSELTMSCILTSLLAVVYLGVFLAARRHARAGATLIT